MPKKRPITTREVENLKKILHDSYHAVLLTKSVFGGHYKDETEIMMCIEKLTADHLKLLDIWKRSITPNEK